MAGYKVPVLKGATAQFTLGPFPGILVWLLGGIPQAGAQQMWSERTEEYQRPDLVDDSSSFVYKTRISFGRGPRSFQLEIFKVFGCWGKESFWPDKCSDFGPKVLSAGVKPGSFQPSLLRLGSDTFWFGQILVTGFQTKNCSFRSKTLGLGHFGSKISSFQKFSTKNSLSEGRG